MTVEEAGEEAGPRPPPGTRPRPHWHPRCHRSCGRGDANRHLAAVRASRARGRVARPIDRVGAEEVGTRRQLGQPRPEDRPAGLGLELGGQLRPLGGSGAPVVDRPGSRTGVPVADEGTDLIGKLAAALRREGDLRRHIVEAQRQQRDGARVAVARLVAEPDLQ